MLFIMHTYTLQFKKTPSIDQDAEKNLNARNLFFSVFRLN